MSIGTTAILPVSSIAPLPGNLRVSQVTPQSHEGGFGEMVGNAVQQLNDLQRNSEAAAMDLSTGKSANLHGALVSMEEASLAMQLTLQVRNKVVESYQEVMRMQV